MRALTFVQQRIAEVRAERRALLERAAARSLRDDDDEVERVHVESWEVARAPRSLLRGEIEPEVVIAEDGTVCLAPLEWSTEASDAGEQ